MTDIMPRKVSQLKNKMYVVEVKKKKEKEKIYIGNKIKKKKKLNKNMVYGEQKQRLQT